MKYKERGNCDNCDLQIKHGGPNVFRKALKGKVKPDILRF
jgi:hypothetical protein